MACCASCEEGEGCAGELGAVGPRARAARPAPGGHLPGMLCPLGETYCYGACRPHWHCVNWASQHAALGALGSPQWYRVRSGLWGQIGWYYGSDVEAALLPSSDLDPCEHTGAACLPFPGAGEDVIIPRPRYWELWDQNTGGWRGWLHSDSKGALLVAQGSFTLELMPSGAPIAPPPVGRPEGDEPEGGDHGPPGTVLTTGAPSRGRWIAGGIAAGVGLLAFALGR